MKKTTAIFTASILAATSAYADKTVQVFDHANFYDGYLVDKIPADAPDQGYNRLFTSLNTVKLTDEQLASIGEKLRLIVDVFPVCDNYDRIGSVNLALVPKGTPDYKVNYDSTDPVRIEVARFITPFMDRNKIGDPARYQYQINDFARILRDKELREKYDFWMELMIFGVPYAAQNEIMGCAGCNETFQGSVTLLTDDTPAPLIDTNVFVPIVTRSGDWSENRGINNYDPNCTDEVGKTIKTYKFTVPEDCADGRVVLVMSNHGAGQNGEEYVRRHHYAYVDGKLNLEFIPGRPSCEPFRARNSQGNGIYGRAVKNNAMWQSFSNWCPGDKIDLRYLDLGEVKAGEHTMRIEVPDAEFYGKDGYFPVSMYFQGDVKEKLPEHPELVICWDNFDTSVKAEGNKLTVTSPKEFQLVEVYDETGKLMLSSAFDTIDIAQLPADDYQIAVIFPNGIEIHNTPIGDPEQIKLAKEERARKYREMMEQRRKQKEELKKKVQGEKK